MYKSDFIRFKKEKSFSEVQKSLMDKLGDKFSECFVGNPDEIKKGLQRSFYPYRNVSENLKVLPYYFNQESGISLCISCSTRYVDGSVIPPKLKIIGICIEYPWYKGFPQDLQEMVKAINKWWIYQKNSSLLGTVFTLKIFELSLDRKGIPVLIMHIFKTFLERVFGSDFYSL